MTIYQKTDELGNEFIAEVDEKNLKIRLKKNGLTRFDKTNHLYVFETAERFLSFFNTNVKLKKLIKTQEF